MNLDPSCFSRGFRARRRGGSKGSNEPPLKINNDGLKKETLII